MDAPRVLVRCDCHGTETMCARMGDRIVIRKREHGVTHTCTILLEQPVTLATRQVPMKCGTD